MQFSIFVLLKLLTVAFWTATYPEVSATSNTSQKWGRDVTPIDEPVAPADDAVPALQEKIARHYTHGSLESAILAGFRAMGRDPSTITPEDLAAIDEFHIGGHEATADVADHLGLGSGGSLLDVGSGIGGAARFFARRYGCRVVGIDLTPEFVDVAKMLTQHVGLSDRVEFHVASALALPFDDKCFDRATLLHVGMNIPDKENLCAEVHRVLKPDGIFAIYDVMRTGDEEIAFPVPWAATRETSFLETPETYRRALAAAGFTIISERNRREFGIAFFQRIRARMAESGPPPLGLHILMGQDAPTKAANMLAGLEQNAIAPIEIICRRG
jgi:SAM-dependent methyltransferase